jgi:hypothetical protein
MLLQAIAVLAAVGAYAPSAKSGPSTPEDQPTAAPTEAVASAPSNGTRNGAAIVAGPRVYRAVRTVDPIVIDGRDDEATWQIAPLDDRFRERQPELDGVPPVRTSLRIAYDDLALYVFIDAQSDPGDVVVRTLRRDNSGIFSDDTVYVKLDPNHDRRTAYILGVNADGAQIDVLGLEDGRVWITEWDGVWEAETMRREDGYTVEFRIPFAMLGVKSADERTMGINITRDQPRRNATYDWKLFVPPRSPSSASQFGEVVGLRNIRAQRALEYLPYALARTNFRPDFTVDPRRAPNLAAGGDVRLQIGAGSYVEATLLTDFAQVEVDEVQVARDRFPLFFPERRPFFINGLDVFNFGRAGEAQLFFSRQVGLVDGRPVPILGGLKIYGRAGPISYGVLQVQTLGAPAEPERGIVESDPQLVTVGRVRVQATEAINVGMLMLGTHEVGTSNRDNAAGGVDAQLIGLDGRLQWYSFLAGTFAERPETDPIHDDAGALLASGRPPTDDIGASAHSFIEYRGLFVRPSMMWLWSDRHFDPRLGFYRRPATSRQEAGIDFAPRPEVLGLREIIFGPRYSTETTAGYDQWLGQQAMGRVQLNWKNGSEIGYEVAHFIDEVQDPFELYLHTIDDKRYTGFRHRWSARSPAREVLSLDTSYEIIELFGGKAHQPTVGVTARVGKHFTFGSRYTHLVGHFENRQETFDFGFANANVDIALTRDLAFDNLVRLDLSPGFERLGIQSRLRWRFAPGSDLFVVYRNNLPFDIAVTDPFAPPRVQFHEITVKVSYYMRALLRR